MTATKVIYFQNKRSLLTLVPLFGCLLFVALYVIATLCYPGGSPVDKHAVGFSWTENYWCNLLNETAINGQHNPARLVALAATMVLCISLVAFWYVFPLVSELGKRTKSVIQVCGFLSVMLAFFLSSAHHDAIINISAFFGLVALGGTFIGLKKMAWTKTLWVGAFMFVLVGLNNLCYYCNVLPHLLPMVQKITFLYFLAWICCVSIGLHRQMKTAVCKSFSA